MTNALVGVTAIFGILGYLIALATWAFRVHERVEQLEKGIMLCALYLNDDMYAEKSDLPENARDFFPSDADRVTCLELLREQGRTKKLFDSINSHGRLVHSERAIIYVLVVTGVLAALLPVLTILLSWDWLGMSQLTEVRSSTFLLKLIVVTILPSVAAVITAAFTYWYQVNRHIRQYRPSFLKSRVIEVTKPTIDDIVDPGEHTELSDVWRNK